MAKKNLRAVVFFLVLVTASCAFPAAAAPVAPGESGFFEWIGAQIARIEEYFGGTSQTHPNNTSVETPSSDELGGAFTPGG